MSAPHSQGRRSSNSSQGGRCIISLSFHTQSRTACTCHEPQPCRTVGELANILPYFSAAPALLVRTASCSFSLTGASRRKDYSSLPSRLEATKQTCRPKKTSTQPFWILFFSFFHDDSQSPPQGWGVHRVLSCEDTLFPTAHLLALLSRSTTVQHLPRHGRHTLGRKGTSTVLISGLLHSQIGLR